MNGKQSRIFNDEKRQVESGDSYTFGSKVGEVTNEKAEVSFSGFTGLYSMWDLTSSSELTTTLSISGNIQHGKFKLIEVTPDQQLVTLWEGDGDSKLSVKIPPGTTTIKWVGKRASGKLHLELAPQKGLQAELRTELLKD
ncbi:hypothetical protein [Paenibacillus sp. CAA11]|uniref:hypothetical protein n=1 Tax=Paenibacillus sp. CAA11 TaxID=1532905 RepID=UPI001F19DFF5|nr:hypothetical protein [Paenibacillus sp. CAA11]